MTGTTLNVQCPKCQGYRFLTASQQVLHALHLYPIRCGWCKQLTIQQADYGLPKKAAP